MAGPIIQLTDSQTGYIIESLLEDLSNPQAMDEDMRKEMGALFLSLTGEKHSSFITAKPVPIVEDKDKEEVVRRCAEWKKRHPAFNF